MGKSIDMYATERTSSTRNKQSFNNMCSLTLNIVIWFVPQLWPLNLETPEEQVTLVHRHNKKYSINHKLTKIHYQQSLTQAFIFGKTNWTIKS